MEKFKILLLRGNGVYFLIYLLGQIFLMQYFVH